MAHERHEIRDVTKKYFALFILQCIVTVGLIVCPTISVAVTSFRELRPWHVYGLAGLTFIQTIMSGLTYHFGKKTIPGEANKKCGVFITVGIAVGFPEFAAILVVFVMVGVFIGNGPTETNERLAYAILALNGLALLANILTMYMGCTLGHVLGANFSDSNSRVRPDTTRRGSGTRESRELHLHIHGDQTAHIQQLQIQNSILQQQLLLQQQQQLNEQQRRNRGEFDGMDRGGFDGMNRGGFDGRHRIGFEGLSPAPNYSENPPPYSSIGHTPSYMK